MIEIHKTNAEIDSNRKHVSQKQYGRSMPVGRFETILGLKTSLGKGENKIILIENLPYARYFACMISFNSPYSLRKLIPFHKEK